MVRGIMLSTPLLLQHGVFLVLILMIRISSGGKHEIMLNAQEGKIIIRKEIHNGQRKTIIF